MHIGQAHIVADPADRCAFELETGPEIFGEVTSGAAETEHRIFLIGLVQVAADQVGVFVGFEIGQADDDRFRVEGRGNRADAFSQLVDKELHGIRIAGHLLIDGSPGVGVERLVLQ